MTDGVGGSQLSAHSQFLGAPALLLARLAAPQPPLSASIGPAMPDGTLPVTLTFAGGAPVESTGLPLCATLTSPFAGRFSRNAFTPLSLPVNVSFIPWGPTPDPLAFAETLRVQHLGQYAPGA